MRTRLTGAAIVPIYLTSTFTQQGIGKHMGYEYSRTGNPTGTSLETCLASLEEGRYGLAFASALAATTAVLSLLRPAAHVIADEDLYGGTYRLFEKVYAPQQIAFSYVDGTRPEEFAGAIRRETRLAWIEAPTNALLQLIDIREVADVCRRYGILLVVALPSRRPICNGRSNLVRMWSFTARRKTLEGTLM